VEALEKARVPFHCTGGIVSSLYGEPRLTQDIDIVVRLADASDLERLLLALQPKFLIDEIAARQAWRSRRMFQALDQESFVKIDFHVGEDVPGELSRTAHIELLPGLTVPVVIRENAILSKLLWIRKGSHKSGQDVLGMLRRSGPVDWPYLRETAEKLGVGGLLCTLEEENREGI